MSKIKDIMTDVIERLEAGVRSDEIAYYVSYTYGIPYEYEVMEIIEKIRSTMNRTNECVEEYALRF